MTFRKGFLFIVSLIVGVVFSSCNIDEEITTDIGGEDGSAMEHYRPALVGSSPYWNKVYEYTPAPGQFIIGANAGGFAGSQRTPEGGVG